MGHVATIAMTLGTNSAKIVVILLYCDIVVTGFIVFFRHVAVDMHVDCMKVSLTCHPKVIS